MFRPHIEHVRGHKVRVEDAGGVALGEVDTRGPGHGRARLNTTVTR